MSRYSDLVAEQGATNYWSFNETSGAFFDSIGGVTLGTVSSTVARELAVVGNSATFDGVSVARTSAADSTIKYVQTLGFSYSYIARFRSYTTNNGIVCKRVAASTNTTFASLMFNAGAGTGLAFDIGDNQRRWTIGYYPPLNEWVHVTYTYEPSTLTGAAYINGVLHSTTNYTDAPLSSTVNTHVMIGALQSSAGGGANNNLSGSVNALALFTQKTLSAAEVSAQYHTAFPITRVFDGTNWHDADKRVIS